MIIEKIICDTCQRELGKSEEYEFNRDDSARIKFKKIYINASYQFEPEKEDMTICSNCMDEIQDHILAHFTKNKFMHACKKAMKEE